ncbi:MAG: hypothetical protein ACHQQR_09285 [Gemmatimonadales bacterium]
MLDVQHGAGAPVKPHDVRLKRAARLAREAIVMLAEVAELLADAGLDDDAATMERLLAECRTVALRARSSTWDAALIEAIERSARRLHALAARMRDEVAA